MVLSSKELKGPTLQICGVTDVRVRNSLLGDEGVAQGASRRLSSRSHPTTFSLIYLVAVPGRLVYDLVQQAVGPEHSAEYLLCINAYKIHQSGLIWIC